MWLFISDVKCFNMSNTLLKTNFCNEFLNKIRYQLEKCTNTGKPKQQPQLAYCDWKLEKPSLGRFKCNVDASFFTSHDGVGFELVFAMEKEILW